MTYTIVPNSGQSLGITRVPINTNFSLIQSVFAANHIGFNNTGAGKHSLIQMPTVQAASPGTAAGEVALYTRTVAGVPQLFYQSQSIAAAGTDVQMTKVIAASLSTLGGNANYQVGVPSSTGGWSFLPGGLIMNYATSTSLAAGANVVNFACPFPNACISVVITPVRTNNPGNVDIVYVQTKTASNFTCYNTSNSGDISIINWFAIGF